jgi:hypothetical protein
MHMNNVIILDFVNLFFAGMLAGMEFVIHYGVRGPAEVGDERSRVLLRQALSRTLRILVPAFFLPAAISGIAVAILDHAADGFWFRIVGVAMVFAWILGRVVGTVPINKASMSWNPDAPPKNWKELVERAERFHIYGTWAAVAGFISFLIGAALKLTQ